MCLIAIAPKGTQKYDEFYLNAIKKASISNTDGIGYSFKRASNPNRVWIAKGFKDIDKFITSLKHKRLKDEDELVIHLRIGNKGAKTTDMNHPFVVSNDTDEILTNDSYVQKPTMCHNGTFFEFSETGSSCSDTFFFVRDFISTPELQTLLKRDQNLFKKMFKGILRTNRLAFIFPGDTSLITLGDFIEENGYIFSNESYKRERYSNVGGMDYWDSEYSGSENWRTFRGNQVIADRSSLPVKRPLEIDFETRENTRQFIDKIVKNSEEIQENWSADNHVNEEDIVSNEITLIKPVSRRHRNERGLLEASSKFDIIPIRGTPLFQKDNLAMFFSHFGESLWVKTEYIASQFTECKFVPRYFNYKHFSLRCINSKIGTFGYREGLVYEITDFDTDNKTNMISHEIDVIGEHSNRTQAWINPTEILTHFRIQPKEEFRKIYFDVFRLMKAYENTSKTNYSETNKTITKAISQNKTEGISHKKLSSLSLAGLKIYNDYLGLVLFNYPNCTKGFHRVQRMEVYVN